MRKWSENTSTSNRNKAQAVKWGSREPSGEQMNGEGHFLIRTPNTRLHFIILFIYFPVSDQASCVQTGFFVPREHWTQSTITCLCASQHDTISCKSPESSGSGSLPRACLLQNTFSPWHLQDLTCSVIRAGLRHHIQSASPLISSLPQKKKEAWLNCSKAHLPHYTRRKVPCVCVCVCARVWTLWLDF